MCVPQTYAEKNIKLYKAFEFKDMENCEYIPEFKQCNLLLEYDVGNHTFTTYLSKHNIVISNFTHIRSYKKNDITYSDYYGDLPDGQKQFITFARVEDSRNKYIILFDNDCSNIILRVE